MISLIFIVPSTGAWPFVGPLATGTVPLVLIITAFIGIWGEL